MLALAAPVIGLPAAGKSTLTRLLSATAGVAAFRLRDHVPAEVLASSVTTARRAGWIPETVVARAVRQFVRDIAASPEITAVVFDNFPGNGAQTLLLHRLLLREVSDCRMGVVHLHLDDDTARGRARQRRVCATCEPHAAADTAADAAEETAAMTAADPRLPAIPDLRDPQRCSVCAGMLSTRPGDAPEVLRIRLRRAQRLTRDIKATCHALHVPVRRLDARQPPEDTATQAAAFLDIVAATAASFPVPQTTRS